MKRLLSFSLLLLLVASCSKENQVAAPAPAPRTFDNMTTAEKTVVFATDPDMVAVLNIQRETLRHLVASPENLARFDFSDRTAVLRVLGLTPEQYAQRIAAVRQHALAFIGRYRIPAGGCQTCSMSAAEKMGSLNGLLGSLQADPVYYHQMDAGLGRGLLLVNTPQLAEGDGCGFWFYACVALCAASTEVLPVYLLCCAYCYHAECTKD
jgi:hypothetical protein